MPDLPAVATEDSPSKPSCIAHLQHHGEDGTFSKWFEDIIAAHQCEDDVIEKDRSRSLGKRFLEASAFKYLITAVILLNTIMVVYETDLQAECDRDQPPASCGEGFFITRVINSLFLVVYVGEMCLRIFVFRVKYFLTPSDIADCLIVFIGIAGELLGGYLPGIGALRLFRVARVVRALRAVDTCDEVHIFISGLWSCTKAIAVGFVLIFISTFLWAIVAVILVNPASQHLYDSGVYEELECLRCRTAFSSVGNAMVTFLQTIIMGDGWGECALPIIAHAPWTSAIFIGAFGTISLGLTNLILAVILDKALENRDLNTVKEAATRLGKAEEARRHFVSLCHQIDKDKSGNLTLEELEIGMLEQPDFAACLTLLDITQADLSCVFQMMDRDGSGEVSYEEFSLQLHNLKAQDMHTMISFIKFYVVEMHDELSSQHVEVTKLAVHEVITSILDGSGADASEETDDCSAVLRDGLSPPPRVQYKSQPPAESAPLPLALAAASSSACTALESCPAPPWSGCGSDGVESAPASKSQPPVESAPPPALAAASSSACAQPAAPTSEAGACANSRAGEAAGASGSGAGARWPEVPNERGASDSTGVGSLQQLHASLEGQIFELHRRLELQVAELRESVHSTAGDAARRPRGAAGRCQRRLGSPVDVLPADGAAVVEPRGSCVGPTLFRSTSDVSHAPAS